VPDIFSEVDEEVRRERMATLWKRFGPVLIGAVVLFIAGMGGKIYWDKWREGERIAESDRYQQALALLEQGDAPAARGILEDLGADSQYGYRLLSRLQLAASLAREGKRGEAIAAFDAISAETDFEPRYRDYAVLMAASLVIDEGNLAEAEERLKPLQSPESPWYFSGRELQGTILQQEQKYDLAEDVFAEILNAEKAPPDMKARAQEMLLVIEAAKPLAGDGENVADQADGE